MLTRDLHRHRHRTFILLILVALTITSLYLGTRLHANSIRDKNLKADYFVMNQIRYGILSGENWSFQVNRILAEKIDSFQFTNENGELIQAQLNVVLNRLLDEVQKTLHKERGNLKDKIRYGLMKNLISIDDFRKEVPRYSAAITQELQKSRYRDELKSMVKEKVTGLLGAVSQDSLGEKVRILSKYNMQSLEAFNQFIADTTNAIRQQQKVLGYGITGMLLAVLLLWLYVFHIRSYFAVTFLFSVLISMTALFTGISLPMIEIDARISDFKLSLLSEHIVFSEQVIFYQAKSILDVVHILITNGKADTVFVGFLVFLFSVLFPVTKLICTTIYLFADERSGAFVKFMAFNSGKWSMADVMVIAIFMSYVGFQSILDDQLADITVTTETVNVISTNRTNLQTGFVVFVGFCLFNLVLAEILKHITKIKIAERAAAVTKKSD